MADLSSQRSKMNDIEIQDDAALSEALFLKYGQNINYLIDERDTANSRLNSLEGQTTANKYRTAISTTIGTVSSSNWSQFNSQNLTTKNSGIIFVGLDSINGELPVSAQVDVFFRIVVNNQEASRFNRLDGPGGMFVNNCVMYSTGLNANTQYTISYQIRLAPGALTKSVDIDNLALWGFSL